MGRDELAGRAAKDRGGDRMKVALGLADCRRGHEVVAMCPLLLWKILPRSLLSGGQASISG